MQHPRSTDPAQPWIDDNPIEEFEPEPALKSTPRSGLKPRASSTDRAAAPPVVRVPRDRSAERAAAPPVPHASPKRETTLEWPSIEIRSPTIPRNSTTLGEDASAAQPLPAKRGRR